MAFEPHSDGDLVGEDVEGFVVQEVIASGASSTVYRAIQEAANQRAVALKVMRATEQRLQMVGKAEINPLWLETRISQVVRHPSIVRIFRTGRAASGRYYVAMEFVDGTSLDRVLAEGGRFAWRDAVALLRQLTAAVAAMHAQRIVHRDLKPGNVLVKTGSGRAPRIKLIDFGVAAMLSSREPQAAAAADMLVGTPQYMAPEQARGEAPTYAADVYALGAVAYELLTGKPVLALERPSSEACVAYLRSGRPLPSLPLEDLAPEVPLAIVDLVEACLAVAPGDRPRDAGILGADLESAARDAEDEDPEPGFFGKALEALSGLFGGGRPR